MGSGGVGGRESHMAAEGGRKKSTLLPKVLVVPHLVPEDAAPAEGGERLVL